MRDWREIEEAAAGWLARRDAGGLTEAEQDSFARWLQASPAHRVAYLRIEAAWQQTDRLQVLRAGGQASAPPSSRESDSWRRTATRIAASVALLALLFGAIWQIRSDGDAYRTAIGGIATVPMPDGSSAILNTASEIKVSLTDTERRVHLRQGEVFFEVTRDEKRPFVVDAGKQRVVAVGTAFAVRRDGDDVRVVVTEGTVRVEHVGAPAALPVTYLSAGTVAIVNPGGTLVQPKPPVDVDALLGWRQGFLVFRDITLGEAVAEFNRYNARQLRVEDPALVSIRIGGSFRATNVEAFVRLLEEGFSISVHDDGDTILLVSD